jgi:uncharacterized protein YtpQ (UPF0354 family)
VPLRLFAPVACLAAVLAVLAAVSACGGGDGESSPSEDLLLDETSFAQVVAGELRKADLEATATRGLLVHVANDLDWVEPALEEPFRKYRGDPERREEIVAEVVRETAQQLEEGISELSFAEASDSLRPLLKPRFEIRTLAEKPAETAFPANLAVVYVVHRERDFTIVTPADLERWGEPLATIHEVAVANLARQTNAKDELLCESSQGNELCGWASGDGYDATRMIVPELRRDIVREIGPAVYAVPREDVFVALPVELAPRIEAKVLRDFTTAPNPVSPRLFVERSGELVPLAT